MVVQFAGRPEDSKRLIAEISQQTRAFGKAFCGKEDDQVLGAYISLSQPACVDCIARLQSLISVDLYILNLR